MERTSSYALRSVEEAVEVVVAEAGGVADAMEVALSGGVDADTSSMLLGCVLARDVISQRPFPPFRASIMDGYAVRVPEGEEGAGEGDGTGVFPVVARVLAGLDPDDLLAEATGGELLPGQVAYVTTGAKLPRGANAVVKVEDTEGVAPDGSSMGAAGMREQRPDETEVRILKSAPPGKWIRPIGCDVAEGEVVLPAGTKLDAADIGLLAMVGAPSVSIFRPPCVGVLSTGSELVRQQQQQEADGPAVGACIHDSNRPSLLAALQDSGVNAVDLGIANDDSAELEAAVVRAMTESRCDIIVSSGGVSMGTADLVKPLLEKLGTVHFGRILMKPGKPTTFATLTAPSGRKVLFFALPGNPVSCLVTKVLLVDPAVRRMQGLAPEQCTLPPVLVQLQHEITLDPERPEYHRATVYFDMARACLVAQSTGVQRSSKLLSMRGANALLCIPRGEGQLAAGVYIPAMLFQDIITAPAMMEAPRSASPPLHQQREHLYHDHGHGHEHGHGHGHGHGHHHDHHHGHHHHRMPSPPPPDGDRRGRHHHGHHHGHHRDHHHRDHHHRDHHHRDHHHRDHHHGHHHGHHHAHDHGPPGHSHEGCALSTVRVAVLTISDSTADGSRTDTAGPAVVDMMSNADLPFTVEVVATAVVPDNTDRIQEILRGWCDRDTDANTEADDSIHIVLTTGGTGFGPRDLTPEAVRPMLDREAPGIAMAMLNEGLRHTELAVLSRPVSGLRGKTFVATLPGSEKAVRENLRALFPLFSRILTVIHTGTC